MSQGEITKLAVRQKASDSDIRYHLTFIFQQILSAYYITGTWLFRFTWWALSFYVFSSVIWVKSLNHCITCGFFVVKEWRLNQMRVKIFPSFGFVFSSELNVLQMELEKRLSGNNSVPFKRVYGVIICQVNICVCYICVM